MKKNDTWRRVLKKLENINNILSTLYLSKDTSGEQYLSQNQLISITNMPDSTLKGGLKKLVEDDWVEEKLISPDANGRPEARTDYLKKVRIKCRKNRIIQFWVPSEKEKEFEKKLFSLKRTKKTENLDETITDDEKTYEDKLRQKYKGKKLRNLKNFDLVIKGKTKLVNSLRDNWLTKKPILFYRIIVFPYVVDKRVEGRTILSTNEMIAKRWYDIPKKHEPFWKEAAKGLRIEKI